MSPPSLVPGLSLDLGTLTARASLQDPMVRVEALVDGPAVLTLEEGGVRLDLEFPDLSCVERLFRRLRREAIAASTS